MNRRSRLVGASGMRDGSRRGAFRLMSRRWWRGSAVAATALAVVAAVGLVKLNAEAAVTPDRFAVEEYGGLCLAYSGSGRSASPIVLAGCQANNPSRQW